MRSSRFLLATLKETPTDAEIVSHQLMLRAGMIRRVAAGVYDWLPLGLRVLRKIETIVREEMNASDAQEVLLPAVQPAELWQESGRWDDYGPELLRLTDRHQRDYCFGPTHEEIITALAKSEIQSYRQLPANFYQIQTKFRDEIRPRFGVMRAREFIMKDAYSFDIDPQGMGESYQVMYRAYERIFARLGLETQDVEADKDEGQHADAGAQDGGVVEEVAKEHRPRRDPQSSTGQQQNHAAAVKRRPVVPHREHVAEHQQGQQQCDSVHHRNRQRNQRRPKNPGAAPKPSLGDAKKEDRHPRSHPEPGRIGR